MAKEPGVYESAQSDRARNLWLRLAKLWDVAPEHRIEGGMITEVRIKAPRFDGDQILVMVKARDDNGNYVAFSEGVDAPSALASALARAEQKALKWRTDEYAGGGKPGSGGVS